MNYGWRNEWRGWKPYNRPLSKDELPYLSSGWMAHATKSWDQEKDRSGKTEAVEEET